MNLVIYSKASRYTALSSKTAPRIFIFSIVLGAENLSYVKSIATHARAFLTLNILSIGKVHYQKMQVVHTFEL
jgi:hypothetical protein